MRALKDITLGQFFPGTSLLHRIDARAKILLSVIIALSLLTQQSLLLIVVWGAIVAAAIKTSTIPPKFVLRNLRAFRFLFAITFILNIAFAPEDLGPRISFWGFSLSVAVLEQALLNCLRLALFILFSALLTLTTSPLEITDALERMLKPVGRLGLPVQDFALMVSLAMRFVPTLLQEADRLRKAQLSRGVQFRGSLLRRLHALIPLTLPLFLAAFQRAEELAVAMEARCFLSGQARSSFHHMVWEARDTVLLTGGLVVTILTRIFG